MQMNELTFLILVIVISLEIGAVTAYLMENRKYDKLRYRYARLIEAYRYAAQGIRTADGNVRADHCARSRTPSARWPAMR